MGRKPAGPDLVDGLHGSEYAKKRLKVILQTLQRELTIEEACKILNVGRTRFFDLRQAVLEEMLGRLEPRPAGRPPNPKPDTRIEELEAELERKEAELELVRVRLELDALRPASKKNAGWSRRSEPGP